MRTFTVVMAGGGGTRFWPLSRKNCPKQLLNLSGRDIMLNDTILRMEPLVERTDAYVVTNAMQAGLTKELLLDGVEKEHVLTEPVGRNTAPCILYAALSLNKNYGDGVMCVLPADHFIANEPEYRRVMESAISLAEKTSGLVTIGIKPDYPATGYGYIACGDACDEGIGCKVEGFKEKPDAETAAKYIDSGRYLWNSGVFVWKISAIIKAFEKYLPEMYADILSIYDDLGTDGEQSSLQRVYPDLQSISIDYGVMEKADNVYVIPGDYGWNDVGSLDALNLVFNSDEDGNAIKGDVLISDSKDCIATSDKKLIVLAGCENLMVIDTEDTLLVCPKAYAQNVKHIVDRLNEEGRKEI